MNFPVLLCRSIKGAFCQSLLEHTQTTHPMLTQVHSLFSHTSNCLTFCASSILLPNTRLFKKCLQSLIRQRFFCFVSFLAHKILQNPIVLGRKMEKFSRGQTPDPLPSSDTTQTSTPATPLLDIMNSHGNQKLNCVMTKEDIYFPCRNSYSNRAAFELQLTVTESTS